MASVTAEVAPSLHSVNILFLAGWSFVFSAVGARLFIKGTRQVIQPRFTAEEILGIDDRGSFAVGREVGLPTCAWAFWEYAAYFAAAGSFLSHSLAGSVTDVPEWVKSSKIRLRLRW